MKPPVIPKLSTIVTKRKHLTDSVVEVWFQMQDPKEIEFKSGQFVFISHKGEDSQIINRSYSIASSEFISNRFAICFNIVPGGQLSPWLGSLKEGDEVIWNGPLGHFVIKDFEDTKEFVFVGTGTGVAPMKSFIETLLEGGEKRPMMLYFGLRSEKNVYYREYFEELAKDNDNFRFVLCLSRPESDSDYAFKTGRVTKIIADEIQSADGMEVYLCGKGEMIDEMKEMLLARGAKKECLITERYY